MSCKISYFEKYSYNTLICFIDPQTLTIEGPDELNTDSDITVICKTSSTYKPSVNMNLNLMSYDIDYFGDLIQTGFLEVKENPLQANEVVYSRSLKIKSDLLWNHCTIGRTITIQCSIEEDCHGEKVYKSTSKTITLNGGYFLSYSVLNEYLLSVFSLE